MIALPLLLSNFLGLPKVLYFKLAWSDKSLGYLNVQNEEIKCDSQERLLETRLLPMHCSQVKEKYILAEISGLFQNVMG